MNILSWQTNPTQIAGLVARRVYQEKSADSSPAAYQIAEALRPSWRMSSRSAFRAGPRRLSIEGPRAPKARMTRGLKTAVAMP